MAGEEITLERNNGDGATHTFEIVDSDDNVLHLTEFVSEPGESASLEFVMTPEMAGYRCQPHSGIMNGDINVTEPTDGVGAVPYNPGNSLVDP